MVVGVPGRFKVLNGERVIETEREDLQHDRLPDPTLDMLRHLATRVVSLEHTIHGLHLEDDPEMAKAWVAAGGSHI